MIMMYPRRFICSNKRPALVGGVDNNGRCHVEGWGRGYMGNLYNVLNFDVKLKVL